MHAAFLRDAGHIVLSSQTLAAPVLRWATYARVLLHSYSRAFWGNSPFPMRSFESAEWEEAVIEYCQRAILPSPLASLGAHRPSGTSLRAAFGRETGLTSDDGFRLSWLDRTSCRR